MDRLARLPTMLIWGLEVPVAATRRARLLGLAALHREDAGAGLLLPRCRSIHTFGMRFAVDVLFLDADGLVVKQHAGVGPHRILCCRRADSVLELVASDPAG